METANNASEMLTSSEPLTMLTAQITATVLKEDKILTLGKPRGSVLGHGMEQRQVC